MEFLELSPPKMVLRLRFWLVIRRRFIFKIEACILRFILFYSKIILKRLRERNGPHNRCQKRLLTKNADVKWTSTCKMLRRIRRVRGWRKTKSNRIKKMRLQISRPSTKIPTTATLFAKPNYLDCNLRGTRLPVLDFPFPLFVRILRMYFGYAKLYNNFIRIY